MHFLIVAALLLTWLWPATASAKEADTPHTFTIVIDPGHGGGDVGTPHRRGRLDEKAVALNVALRLGKLIETGMPGTKVVYTRQKDVYPSLPERTQIAKHAKGDLFISIHVNAAPDGSARGFETYVFGASGVSATASEKQRMRERMAEERENLDISGRQVNFDTDIDIDTKILCQAQREKHNKQSSDLAREVHFSLIAGLKQTSYAANVNNRGIKPKNLFVLCYCPMPAILVELGYMSNHAEERFINTDEAQSCFARSLYNGILRYKQDWDKRQLSRWEPPVMPEGVEQPTLKRPSHTDTPKAEAPKPEAPKPSTPGASTPKPTAPGASTPKPGTPGASTPKPGTAAPAQKADTAKAEGPRVATPKPTTPSASTPKPGAATPPASQPGQETWRVQFMTSDKEFRQGAPELKGLWPVVAYRDNGLWKFTYGNAATQAEAAKLLPEVRRKFPDAFLVHFDKEGKRIR